MNRPRMAWAAIAALAVCVSVASASQRRSHIMYTGAASDTTALWMADSVGPYFTGDCERLYLYLKPDGPCRVAIQVRAHGDSISGSGTPALNDTTKTFAWAWGVTTASTVDTLAYRYIKATQFTASTDEMVYTFLDNTSMVWGHGRGVVIPLRGRDGEWYWGQHTSIRLRVIGPAVGAGGRTVTWTASLQGWAP